MKRTISNIVIVIYIVFAVAITICLLNFNDYKVTEFGTKSLVLITDEKVEPDFKKGDLVIVNSKNKAEVGEKAFLYNTYDRTMPIILAEIKKADVVTETEITYTIEGDYQISSEYFLGKSSEAKIIPHLGGILNVLESKWGFLAVIVLPSLLAFFYEIATVITDIINSKGESKEN